MDKLSRKLQQLNWYPFETLASSNAFLWSFFINFGVLALIILYTHFQNFGLRGDLIGWAIGISEIFGFLMSMVNFFKFRKFKKAFEAVPEHTKEEREEYNEKNSAVGYLWYWIIGTVIAYFVMVPPFAVCKLLF